VFLRLSIVIPAFRERHKISTDIAQAHGLLAKHFAGDGEIIVVDDGSGDGTAAAAEQMTIDVPQLRVLRHAANRGKGYALRCGVAASSGDYVMFADAGGCVPYGDALRGLAALERGFQIAHGSRRLATSTISAAQPAHRRVGSHIFGWLARTFGGVPPELRDTQCGFKVYRGDTARQVFAECFTDGFMIDIELIRRARRRGLAIAEFPVQWHNDPDTRYRPIRGTWRNLRELARIIWRA